MRNGNGQNPVEDPIWSPPGHTDAQRECLSASQHLCSALKENSSVRSTLLVFPFYRKEIKAQRMYLAGKKMGQNLKWAWVQNTHSWLPTTPDDLYMTSVIPISLGIPAATLHTLHIFQGKGQGSRDGCVRGGIYSKQILLEQISNNSSNKNRHKLRVHSVTDLMYVFACNCHSCRVYKAI